LEISDYSFGDRLLHLMVLGVPFINKVSFDFDGLLPDKGQDYPNEKHVFVTGLARAGTTILMRTFFDTGQFRTLTYRDMPFVLMPGIWKKFSKSFHKQEEAKERAHGDGIYVDFDSPEAFEEVFWRTFSGDDYIFDNCLRPHCVNLELIDQFRLYVQRIIKSGGNQQRYLSKNNNNILRLGAIRKAFPKSLIIISFRDSVQQAISLLNQHQKFCYRHSNDKFSYDYMRWLGHHEFGMTHKPFQFNKEPGSLLTNYETDNINYWLNIWINTYYYLLKNAASDSIFVCFEDLCKSPVETLRCLFESADILVDEDRLNKTFNVPPTKDIDGIDENMRDQAQSIYQDLRALVKSPK